MSFPTCKTLQLTQEGHALHVSLNRPESRNAMSLEMVHELMAVFDKVTTNREIRALVLRGTGGHFCAGGDIKDMAMARQQAAQENGSDGYYELNRAFGRMLQQAEQIPQVIIAVCEGAVLGGGFGLACISDIAIATNNAQFGLPETGLGVIPAQIAPFVVKRVGLTQARRLALLGARFNGEEAARIGLVHHVAPDNDAASALLGEVLTQVKRCAPEANRVTKQLLLAVADTPLDTLLDNAAKQFSRAVRGPEGMEGTMAFVQKRLPTWAE